MVFLSFDPTVTQRVRACVRAQPPGDEILGIAGSAIFLAREIRVH